VFSRESDAISPTAHYTAEVWQRNGLSDPALATWEGRALHLGLWPAMTVWGVVGGRTLDQALLARHRLIDELLEAEIEAGRIGQVVEIAAGLSGRGLRFSRRHPALTYVEADLPAMAARKREALAEAGVEHRVAELDAFAASGAGSLDELLASLEPKTGTAIITEGLLNYFPREMVEDLWSRIAAGLRRFEDGLYLADLNLQSANTGAAETAFGFGLGLFVRGRVYFPAGDPDEAAEMLEAAGFGTAVVHSGTEAPDAGRGADRVSILEARP
jgi:O-methyltransferase involved in polyketide biosynthesis